MESEEWRRRGSLKLSISVDAEKSPRPKDYETALRLSSSGSGKGVFPVFYSDQSEGTMTILLYEIGVTIYSLELKRERCDNFREMCHLLPSGPFFFSPSIIYFIFSKRENALKRKRTRRNS